MRRFAARTLATGAMMMVMAIGAMAVVAGPAVAGQDKAENCEKCEQAKAEKCEKCEQAAKSANACPADCKKACCVGKVLSQKAKDIDGNEVSLAEKYQGDVLLIVNVASKCGYTKQYKGLQKLHEKYAEKGLRVVGFPCNQFGSQEPGSEKEIKQFCEATFGVQFDMFSKIKVNGEDSHPLYSYLTSDDLPVKPKGKIKWNFEKFLVDRNGEVIARYRSPVKPTSKKMVKAIERALSEKVASAQN